MNENLQNKLYVKLQELIAIQSEGEWDDAMINSDARKFTVALMPMFAALEAERDALRTDAERYRWLRRGQTFGVVDCIGNDLRADELDSVTDAAIAAKGAQS